eukprot:NODE_1604_length_2424_cov_5.696996.p1 GENE.NODE_1604_length_2424_cov_5.696996~~NODE_1604_length_2424_cov_5.696996.p1  ORF type:complete len:738 (-),score=295.93 NODE_1604_length_2424_cov_5.696996:209-2281(-)
MNTICGVECGAAEVQAELEEQRDLCQGMKSALVDCKERCAELMRRATELSQAEHDVEVLRSEVDFKAGELKANAQQLANMRTEVDNKEAKLQRDADLRDELSHKIAHFDSGKSDDFASLMKEHEAQIARAHKQIETSTREITEIRTEHTAQMCSLREQAEAKDVMLQSELASQAECNEALGELKAERRSLTNAVDEERRDRRLSETKVQELTSDHIGSPTHASTGADQTHLDAGFDAVRLDAEYGAQRALNTRLADERDRHRARLEEERRAHASTTAELDRLKARHADLTMRTATMAHVEARATTVRGELDALRAEHIAQMSEANGCKGSFDVERRSLEDLNERVQTLVAERDAVAARLRQEETLHSNAEAALGVQERHLQKLMANKTETAEAEVGRLQAQVMATNRNLTTVRKAQGEEFAALRAMADSKQQALQEAVDDVYALQQRVVTLKAEKGRAREELRQMHQQCGMLPPPTPSEAFSDESPTRSTASTRLRMLDNSTYGGPYRQELARLQNSLREERTSRESREAVLEIILKEKDVLLHDRHAANERLAVKLADTDSQVKSLQQAVRAMHEEGDTRAGFIRTFSSADLDEVGMTGGSAEGASIERELAALRAERLDNIARVEHLSAQARATPRLRGQCKLYAKNIRTLTDMLASRSDYEFSVSIRRLRGSSEPDGPARRVPPMKQ